MKNTIGIVDDHPAVSLGVASILNAQRGLLVAATAGTVRELIDAEIPLDLVLLDLQLADRSTPGENVRLIHRTLTPQVLVYTAGDRPELVREASRAGALGMVRKSEDPVALVAAVRAALGGETAATPEWAAALDHDSAFVKAQLSAREAEVLSLYASGETAERVAQLLFISRETVIDHIRRIRTKYAEVDRPAPTKVDLFRRAVEDGLDVAPRDGSPRP
ncbi:MAG: response regulator transcription factor [Nocardioides sp.]|uniref:response regulator transcription factor n=1 Tax=Nocardioides sp. TaxID=35761 RepID=UPI003F091813